MSQWKKLNEQCRDTQSNHSGSKPHKYTPKKSFRQQQSPMRFHNQTIDKINSSGISQQKDKPLGRSFIGRAQNDQPRPLKTSSSQLKLHRESFQSMERKNTLRNLGSLANPPLDTDRLKQKNNQNSTNLKMQKTLLFQQIQKLKKQFSTFQSKILRELNRQEKMINQMIKQILDKIASRNNTTDKNQVLQIKTPKHAKFQNVENKFQNKSSIEHSRQLSSNLDNKLQGNKLSSLPKLNINIQKEVSEIGDQKHKSASISSFGRFFQAVSNLKKQLKELDDINDIASSPLHNVRNFNWESFKVA